MRKKYEKLKEEYPAFISLDQFYRICRIAKRSALYLVEHGVVPAVDTGKKTWRYKIAIDDVITYLRRREQWGSMIPPGSVSSRPDSQKKHRNSFASLVKPGMEYEVNEYFAYIYADFPDVLNTQDIMEMTGLSDKTILLLLGKGEIKAITSSPRYIVPKQYFLEFVATPKFIDIKSNSELFQKILGGFEVWKTAKS